jgi:hypothetical protein
MRAQQMPGTPKHSTRGGVLVSVIVIVLAVLVLAVTVARGVGVRVAHNPEGASKTASQHIGNSQPGAAATWSQGGPGLDERSGCSPAGWPPAAPAAGRRYAHRVQEQLAAW